MLSRLAFALFLAAADPRHAVGPFDVKIAPLTLDDKDAAPALGRMSLTKLYHGDLEATAKGEMLTGGDVGKGSAGYVAIERVTGKLHGRSGAFLLQHSATMSHGAQQLSITVVPDSGTGELAGIAGKMSVTIAGSRHSCDFEYTLPEH
jgi:Protein of unknown function (DUF3224)